MFTTQLAMLAFLPMTSGHIQADTQKLKPFTVTLDLSPNVLDMNFMKKNMSGYMPNSVELVDAKPKAIQTEPTYQGRPFYGAFCIGNGPNSVTFFSVDEPKGQKGKLYVDFNQNGDLTDDGSSELFASLSIVARPVLVMLL